MKKFFYLFASAALLLSACTKDEDASLSVSANSLDFGSKAGSKEFTLTANKSWTVQNSYAWITVTPNGGNSGNEQTVTIAVSENTDVDRTGEVVFNIGNDASAKVTVTQDGSVLEYAGVKYRTVKMKDGRTWMAENLRYVPEGKTPSSDPADGNGIWYPYKSDGTNTVAAKDDATIKAEGYLYDYQTAFGAQINESNCNSFEGTQGICPDGWHIPTRTEFINLCGFSTGLYDESTHKMGPNEEKKDAPYYNAEYKGAKLVSLDKDGFNWQFSGMVQVNNKFKVGSYVKTLTKDSSCSVDNYLNRKAMSYLLGSTFYNKNTVHNDDNKTEEGQNYSYFGIMSTFTKTYPEGRITASNTVYLSGYSLRCIKNQ